MISLLLIQNQLNGTQAQLQQQLAALANTSAANGPTSQLTTMLNQTISQLSGLQSQLNNVLQQLQQSGSAVPAQLTAAITSLQQQVATLQAQLQAALQNLPGAGNSTTVAPSAQKSG